MVGSRASDRSTRNFTEEGSVAAVIGRIGADADPRLAEVVGSLIAHLHALVKEVAPTPEEWQAAIRFLTDTGQMCDDRRQEFILLSDVLGVSMLVDAINSRRPDGATENTVLGPFHVDGAPERGAGETISRDEAGEPLVVSGRVTDLEGTAIAGALIDTWQAGPSGLYDVQRPDLPSAHDLRGVFRSGADGGFWYRTVKPSHYGIPDDGPVGGLLRGLDRGNIRPAHLHYLVAAPGYQTVVTHVFDAADPYLEEDAVFGVKHSLVRDIVRVDDPERAARHGVGNPFWSLDTDFVLVPA